MKQFLPKNPPGTPKPEDQEPFWPPRGGTAPPMQPIPPRCKSFSLTDFEFDRLLQNMGRDVVGCCRMSLEDQSDVSKTLLICYILLSNSAFPISARPGEPDYNYGWTPPAGRVPYSPPWPGGAPLTAVDRAEAVAAEVGNEASAAAHSVEEP